MCSVFDNEEVGSGTKQGAGSTFGADVLKYNVAQKYTTDARSAAPEKAAYIYAGQIRDELNWEAVWIYWRKMHTASAISMISQ